MNFDDTTHTQPIWKLSFIFGMHACPKHKVNNMKGRREEGLEIHEDYKQLN